MDQQNSHKIIPTKHNQNPMKTPILSDKFSQKNLIEWPLKVNFPGWYKLHQSWGDWVEKMSLKHAKTWQLTGICDGILSSLHEVNPNPDIVLALCEFWCSKTNTFMFPWGEATITLEDVCILSGLPVAGESVNLPVSGGLGKVLEQKLSWMWGKLCMKSPDKRVSYSTWFDHFNVESGDFGHVGFLVFWLSSFVFPDVDDSNVGKHVFPIAVNIARGVKIALAPAVLSCLYSYLTYLTQHAFDFDYIKREINVPGPFQILQLWVFERFPMIGSKLAKPLSLGQPRIARWDKVGSVIKLVDVRSSLKSNDGFCRRPYALELENWRARTISLDNGKIVSDCMDDDDDELTFFRLFVQPQELIGIDCKAVYFPQRVAMQFEREVTVKMAPCCTLESNHIPTEVVLESNHITNLCNKSAISNGNVISGGLRACDVTKLVVYSLDDSVPKVVAGPNEIEILNASSKRNNSESTTDQSLDNLVLLNSDEETNNKRRHTHLFSRRSAKKVKSKFGDSADMPLYIGDHFGKAPETSGISMEYPIDVENYCC